MRRFYKESLKEGDPSTVIDAEEFRHLSTTLRLGVGGPVSVFNGKGLEMAGAIVEIGRKSAKIALTGRISSERESPSQITLLQGLLKGEKNDLVIQKATELGVYAICVYEAERSVAIMKDERINNKLERWKKIAIEAAKQCGRSMLPVITAAGYHDAVSADAGEVKILLWEEEKKDGLKKNLRGQKPGMAISLLIGPEGGLSKADAAWAIEKGFKPVSFGPRILRAETAAVSAIAAIQYETGDMG